MLVLLGQGFGHRADGTFEFGQVIVDSRLQDPVSGVEVAVGQVIAHAGDLAPWDGGLGIEQFFGQCLDGLADFQQPDPDRVEDQAVGQIPSLQVGADRVDRRRMSASLRRSRYVTGAPGRGWPGHGLRA